MGNKKVILITAVLLAAGAVLLMYVLQNKAVQENRQKVSEVRQQIPQYFQNSEAAASFVSRDAVDTEKVKIEESQQLGDGITYTLNVGIGQAFRQVFDEMQNNGWMAVSGTYSEGEKQYLKLRKADEFIYIILQPQGTGSTQVTLLPLKKK